MKLTRTERLILSNQYRILKALYPEEAEGLTSAEEVVNSGFEFDYETLFDHVYEDELSAEGCKEVIGIMAMFVCLQDSYQDLSDQTGIAKHEVNFFGFSGNEEGMQLAYARHLLKEGRFTNLPRGDNFNSHFPSLDGYRQMLATWIGMGKKNNLSKEEILKIVSSKLPQ